jgi:hypothetical protein
MISEENLRLRNFISKSGQTSYPRLYGRRLGCMSRNQKIYRWLSLLPCRRFHHLAKQASDDVSRSSTESEYVALSTCSQEVVWLGRLLAKFRMTSSTAIPLAHPSSTCQSNLQHADPIPVSCDNQSSIKLAKNPVFHARTKHIEVCHHFVRECALRGEIQLDYISTDINPADILTKALPRPKFEKHRTNLGLVSLTDLCPKL